MSRHKVESPFNAAILKEIMTAQEKTPSDLSAETGISASYLSRILRGGVKNPTIDFVARMSKALHTPIEELLGWSIPSATYNHPVAARLNQLMQNPAISESSKRFAERQTSALLDYLKQNQQ